MAAKGRGSDVDVGQDFGRRRRAAALERSRRSGGSAEGREAVKEQLTVRVFRSWSPSAERLLFPSRVTEG